MMLALKTVNLYISDFSFLNFVTQQIICLVELIIMLDWFLWIPYLEIIANDHRWFPSIQKIFVFCWTLKITPYWQWWSARKHKEYQLWFSNFREQSFFIISINLSWWWASVIAKHVCILLSYENISLLSNLTNFFKLLAADLKNNLQVDKYHAFVFLFNQMISFWSKAIAKLLPLFEGLVKIQYATTAPP